MKQHAPRRIEIGMDELEAIVERARTGPLSEQDYAKLKAALETLGFLTEELEAKGASIDRLRRLLFGPKTERTRDVLGPKAGGGEPSTESAPPAAGDDAGREKQPPQAAGDKPKPKGHGRNGAAAYSGAKRRPVPHPTLKVGESCPSCQKGKLYEAPDGPETLVRVVGRAPLDATITELEKLRCNLCHEIFTAPAPPDVGEKKYDETAGSMIALMRYGTGLPSFRLERLQGSLGIPLPTSTQWDIVSEVAERLEPVLAELIRQAAQGELLHNDDTTMRILELMGKRREKAPPKDQPAGRTGMFTTGIVSMVDGHRIILFFTGWKHAGENLAEVLAQRAAGLQPPIQMCDGLSRNLPEGAETILAGCTAHARRGYIEAATNFPEECRYVLEALGEVYHNDKLARERGLSPEERLRFHQSESGPVMERLERWVKDQLEAKKVEPNSGLGQAMSYMLGHWQPLTLFLRVPGAPLDNTVVERALKKAILHRKGSMFYLTLNGAHVGDLFMSLIYTAEQAGANPFDYLTELQRHAEDVTRDPGRWLPWNYEANLPPPGDA